MKRKVLTVLVAFHSRREFHDRLLVTALSDIIEKPVTQAAWVKEGREEIEINEPESP